MRHWPFPVPPHEELSAEGQWFVSFLEAAADDGCKAYMMEESVVGAAASNGRSVEIIRRGGRGRWWEIGFGEHNNVVESKYIDGFEWAKQAALSWLRGDDLCGILARINSAVVARPHWRSDG